MSDSPLLTPEARREAVRPLLAHQWGPAGPDIGGVLRAFLAAHDPEALARKYVREARSKGETPSCFGFAHWLGLGGDDA